MKKYHLLPHVLTLIGLACAALALMAIFEGYFDAAARYSLLVLLIDRFDGTLARKFELKKRLPGISGESLDMITDLVGLTFVPMMLFYRTGLFVPEVGKVLVVAAAITASFKYARKENFLVNGYSVGAPPIFFSLFLFYFLRLPPIYPTLFAILLIGLCLSSIRYPITCLVTTHWKFGYKSITNYLTTLFFIPVFVMLDSAPRVIYWIMLAQIGVQLLVYPALLGAGKIKPIFDRNS